MFRQIEAGPSFSGLPDEIKLEIFSYLNNAELHAMATTCQSNQSLTSTAYFLREIDVYKEQFNRSVLWPYLTAITGGPTEENATPFTSYIEAMLDEIPNRHHLRSLTAFIGEAQKVRWFNNYPITVQNLQQQAKWLLDELSKHNNGFNAANITSANTFLDLMNPPSVALTEKWRLWHCYHELDRQLTFWILSIKLRTITTKAAFVETITDPLLSRFLTAEELLTIDSYMRQPVPWLIDQIVKEAMRLHYLQDKQETNQTKLQAIEKLLNCLNENDLMSFFKSGTLENKKKLFAEIILSNYPLLTNKLSENSLLNIINFSFDEVADRLKNHPIAVAILNNASILQKLSSRGLVAILDKLALDHPEGITEYPALDPFLTPHLLLSWVDSKKLYKRDKVKAILTNENFLSKLNCEQIAALTKEARSKVGEIFKNNIFIERIKADPRPNQLLLAMAAANDSFCTKEIAKNSVTANLLDPEDVISVCKLNLLAAPFFIKNAAITNKLSSAQLLILFNFYPRPAVKSGCFVKLNDQDFNEFLSKHLGFSKFTDEMLDQMLTEVIKRIPKSASSSPQLPPLLALLQDKIECHQQLEKHFGGLIKSYRGKQAFHEELNRINQWRELSLTDKWKALSSPRSTPSLDMPEEPSYTNSQPRSAKKTVNWGKVAKIVGLSLLAIAGIALIVTGIGTAVGIPLFASTASILFGWLTIKSGLVASITGFMLIGGTSLLASATFEPSQDSLQKESLKTSEICDNHRYPSTYGSMQPRLSHKRGDAHDDSRTFLANEENRLAINNRQLFYQANLADAPFVSSSPHRSREQAAGRHPFLRR